MLSHVRQKDTLIASAITAEIQRQKNGLELIASENIVSEAVLEAMGTPLTNKYSEGYPKKRYYGGNEHIDTVEQIAISRAKELFGSDHVNVQPHSGSNANLAALLAIASPGEPILAMDLSHGGHLTHGSHVNFSGKLFQFTHYGVERNTERIDMNSVSSLAKKIKPKVIIAGFSAYPRHIDFAAFRSIANDVGAILMVDMAHIAGLVAAHVHPDPIPFADIVTTTTHKTLRGPRGGMILCKEPLAKKIDSAVFPGTQGGPLNHVIAGKAVSFLEALSPDFIDYQKQTLKNAHILGTTLQEEGLRIVSGGTDNHLVLVDVTPLGITGKRAEHILENIGISVNKNMIPFDNRNPSDPSGIRLGTPSITTRGFTEQKTKEVAHIIAQSLRAHTNETKLTHFAEQIKELALAHPIYGNFY